MDVGQHIRIRLKLLFPERSEVVFLERLEIVFPELSENVFFAGFCTYNDHHRRSVVRQ